MKDKSWKMKLMLSRDDQLGVDIVGDVSEHTKRTLIRLIQGMENNKSMWSDLTLDEIEGIIGKSMTITDPLLHEAVVSVALDIEIALKNKNT